MTIEERVINAETLLLRLILSGPTEIVGSAALAHRIIENGRQGEVIAALAAAERIDHFTLERLIEPFLTRRRAS